MRRYMKLRKRNLKRYSNHSLMIEGSRIYIDIDDTSDIISPYSENEEPVITSDFADFLENAVKDVPVTAPLKIRISSKEETPNLLSKGIRNYYKKEFIESERQLRQNLKISIVTLVVGIITLILNVVVSLIGSNSVITETIDVFAWVFLWEAVDLFCLRRREIKYTQYREINFMEAIIEYGDPGLFQ